MTATVLKGKQRVVIDQVEGDGGRLSLKSAENCAGIAAYHTLKLMGKTSCGVSLKLEKVEYAALLPQL